MLPVQIEKFDNFFNDIKSSNSEISSYHNITIGWANSPAIYRFFGSFDMYLCFTTNHSFYRKVK